MQTMNEQATDVFNGADPGIMFDNDNETWTIDAGVLVSSQASAGVFSDHANSIVDNIGTVLTAAEFDAGVEFTGDSGLILNEAGARIIGAAEGVLVEGNSETIENHGSIRGLADIGVLFGISSNRVTLTNDGTIFGRFDDGTRRGAKHDRTSLALSR